MSSGPSINIHNSTFLGSDQRIGINDESFNVVNLMKRALEKNGEEDPKRRKVDGENYQPYFYVKNPPPHS